MEAQVPEESGDDPRRARRELATALMGAFAQFGSAARELAVSSEVSESHRSRIMASGLVAGIGCELLQGIVVLADSRCAYASAALVRQLVEIEYLAWAVSEDPEDAIDWLRADHARRLAWWQPGKIRQRADGRFPNSDYRDHCEAGGHPVAETAPKILDNRSLWVEVSLYEACLHGSAAWHYLLQAFKAMDAPVEVDEAHGTVDRLWSTWKAVEPLTRLGRHSGS
ncbi:hypothetical protein [Agromyces sp. GXQ0307]|uniref:hypothetical protein n=1 Tax=Agromyces sp. GXQ0307 TaxID=3377835 RepID=UPI00383A8253